MEKQGYQDDCIACKNGGCACPRHAPEEEKKEPNKKVLPPTRGKRR